MVDLVGRRYRWRLLPTSGIFVRSMALESELAHKFHRIQKQPTVEEIVEAETLCKKLHLNLQSLFERSINAAIKGLAIAKRSNRKNGENSKLVNIIESVRKNVLVAYQTSAQSIDRAAKYQVRSVPSPEMLRELTAKSTSGILEHIQRLLIELRTLFMQQEGYSRQWKKKSNEVQLRAYVVLHQKIASGLEKSSHYLMIVEHKLRHNYLVLLESRQEASQAHAQVQAHVSDTTRSYHQLRTQVHLIN